MGHLKKLISPSIFIFWACYYFIFANSNNTGDALAYAWAAKTGNELFYGHHLLYNFLFWGILKSLAIIGLKPDAIIFMQATNALAGAGIVWLVYKIAIIKHRQTIALWLAALVGSSFSVIRFSTENETYIIPILISLFGYFLFYNKPKSPTVNQFLVIGFWLAFACLFHQLQVWWWLGMFIQVVYFSISNKKPSLAFSFTLPALIVPMAYCAVLLYQSGAISYSSVINLVFDVYAKGNAPDVAFIQKIKFLAINLVRTFIQVHGNLIPLAKQNIYIAFALTFGGIILLVGGILFLFMLKNQLKSRIGLTNIPVLITTALLLGFALFSDGNSEFLIGLPVLLVLMLTEVKQIKFAPIAILSVGLLVYNTASAAYPQKFVVLTPTPLLANFIIENQPTAFIAFDKPTLENYLAYHHPSNKTIIINPPWTYVYQQKPTTAIKNTIDSLLNSKATIFTDCINRPQIASRAQMVALNADSIFFADYNIAQNNTLNILRLNYPISQLLPK